MRYKRGNKIYVVPEISDVLLNGISAFKESIVLGASQDFEGGKQYFLEGDIRPYAEDELALSPTDVVNKLKLNLESISTVIAEILNAWLDIQEEKANKENTIIFIEDEDEDKEDHNDD